MEELLTVHSVQCRIRDNMHAGKLMTSSKRSADSHAVTQHVEQLAGNHADSGKNFKKHKYAENCRLTCDSFLA